MRRTCRTSRDSGATPSQRARSGPRVEPLGGTSLEFLRLPTPFPQCNSVAQRRAPDTSQAERRRQVIGIFAPELLWLH
jgi:hypothetical protein